LRLKGYCSYLNGNLSYIRSIHKRKPFLLSLNFVMANCMLAAMSLLIGCEALSLSSRISGHREPVPPVELHGECGGCSCTVDLRCFYPGYDKPFGAMGWCFAQTYSRVENVSACSGEHMPCAIVRPDDQITHQYLMALNEHHPFKLVSGDAGCVRELPKIRASNWWDKSTPQSILQDQHITFEPKDLNKSYLALQRDALKIQTPLGDGMFAILVIRTKDSKRFERIFTDATESKLTAMLIREGYQVLKHYGNESAKQQISMFSQATAVVGYVGAGMFNTMFSRGQCVAEITTFRPDGRIWLSTDSELLDPFVKWNSYPIPLADLLKTNNISTVPTWGDLNGFEYVDLSDSQVAGIAGTLRTCIATL